MTAEPPPELPDGFDDVLDRVPGWAGRPRSVRPLEGGITNRNWLVAIGAERFVVRSPGKDTDLLGIDRGHEREASKRAASLGIGPEVVAFVEPQGALVTRFVADAETLGPASFARPAVLDAAAGLLRRFHESPPISSVFDWFAMPGDYASTATARGVVVPGTYERSMARAREVRSAFAADPEPPVPCHNDLLGANFLQESDGRLWLLDWEYAGMNDRFFDLGNFAVNNTLDADAEVALVEAYFGDVTTRRLARLRLMKVMSDLREAMWGVVQQGLSALDHDYATYAGEHFDRLLTNAGSAQWSSLLSAAAGD